MPKVPPRLLAPLLALLLWVAGCPPATAGDGGLHYFRIGTGTSSGAYFIVGGLIAGAISNPPGSRPCDNGDGCGVPGLIAVAEATDGGLENLELLRSGALEAALVQANLAAWAYGGTGVFKGKPPFTGLRAIATLYTETVQIVARADGPIQRPADLAGHRISIGDKGSAFALDAAVILGGLGVAPRSYSAVYLRPGASVDELVAGRIDALFVLGGAPFHAIADAAARVPVRLLAISPAEAAALRRQQPYLADAVIPAGVYPGVPETATVGVGAVLVVRDDLDADLIAGITRSLWQPSLRHALEETVARGTLTPLPAAADTAPLPLHPGAARVYETPGREGQ